jgi:hypothetical protein
MKRKGLKPIIFDSTLRGASGRGREADRIAFAVYRDLLRSALAEQDSRAAALDSIRDVLHYVGGKAFRTP